MMSKEMDELFSKSSAKDDITIEVCRLAVIASMRRKKIGQLLLQKIFQVTKFSFGNLDNFCSSRLDFSWGLRGQLWKLIQARWLPSSSTTTPAGLR